MKRTLCFLCTTTWLATLPVIPAAEAFAQNSSTAGANSDSLFGAPSAAVPPSNASTPNATPQSNTTPASNSQDSKNPSNLPTATLTTDQQNKAPVIDPETAANDPTAAAKAQITQPAGTGSTVNNTDASSGMRNSALPAPSTSQSTTFGTSNDGTSATSRSRASLGVNVIGNGRDRGIVVASVRSGTPAEQMGLMPNDRILSLNSQPVSSVDQFIAAVRGMSAGDPVQLAITRDGATRNLVGRLEAFREGMAAGPAGVEHVAARARDWIRHERSASFGGDSMNARTNSASDYDRSSPAAGDLANRLTRVEQRLDQLMQNLSEIRTAVRANGTNTPAVPGPTPSGPTDASGTAPPSR